MISLCCSRATKAALVITAVLLGWIQAGQAQANSKHEGWYQVEMIVFARKDNQAQEHWPSNIKLRYPNNWIELKQPDASASAEPGAKEALVLLPANERQLNTQAQRLERSPSFQVLFHGAWRQLIGAEKSAKSVLIQGGRRFGKHQELEGSIRLSVATYLKLSTNLWYSQFDLNVGQEPSRQWPELPAQPNLFKATLPGLSLESDFELDQALASENLAWDSGSFGANTNEPAVASQNYLTREIILLQQKRDMRTSEVHYIDHPAVGIVIQITPSSVPAQANQ